MHHTLFQERKSLLHWKFLPRLRYKFRALEETKKTFPNQRYRGDNIALRSFELGEKLKIYEYPLHHPPKRQYCQPANRTQRARRNTAGPSSEGARMANNKDKKTHSIQKQDTLRILPHRATQHQTPKTQHQTKKKKKTTIFGTGWVAFAFPVVGGTGSLHAGPKACVHPARQGYPGW